MGAAAYNGMYQRIRGLFFFPFLFLFLLTNCAQTHRQTDASAKATSLVGRSFAQNAATNVVALPCGPLPFNGTIQLAANTLYTSRCASGSVWLPADHDSILRAAPSSILDPSVTVDYSKAAGWIDMAKYFSPSTPSPVVLASPQGSPLTQVFGSNTDPLTGVTYGFSFWITFAHSFASPDGNNKSAGYLYWTWNQYGIYLMGESRDPLQTQTIAGITSPMPSYIIGNTRPTVPGKADPMHPRYGLAYSPRFAVLGSSVTNPNAADWSYYRVGETGASPTSAPMTGVCPSSLPPPGGSSDGTYTGDTEYQQSGVVKWHGFFNFGGTLGWQDAVALVVTNHNSGTTETYLLTSNYGFVGYVDTAWAGMDTIFNTVHTVNDRQNGATGPLLFNYPDATTDCMGFPMFF